MVRFSLQRVVPNLAAERRLRNGLTSCCEERTEKKLPTLRGTVRIPDWKLEVAIF